jgi:hypothetical protein
MTRATEAQLDALHGLLAGALADELQAAIERSRDVYDPEDPKKLIRKGEPINPQLLDKVMKFLGQNGVDSPAQSERKDHLAGVLRDLDLDAESQRSLSH